MLLMPLATVAVADDEYMGHVPTWSVGLGGGLTVRSYLYQDPLLGPNTSSSQVSGLFGITGAYDYAASPGALLMLESTFSLLDPASAFEAHGGLLLGFHSLHQYAERVDDATVLTIGPKAVPTVFGVYLGAGLLSLEDTTATNFGSPTDVSTPLPRLTVPTLEAGVAVAGWPGDFVGAAAFDPVHAAWGGRFYLRMPFYGKGPAAIHMTLGMLAMAGDHQDGLPVFHFAMAVGVGDGFRIPGEGL
jgi:hypothetical protein